MRLSLVTIAAVSATAWGGLLGPTKPTEDDFYTPPKGFGDKYKNGEIIKSRKAPAALKGISADKIDKVVQLMYRSENTFAEAEATLTTVIVPKNADLGKMVSYQTAQDSACLNCAPSYTAMTDGIDDSMVSLLENGWVVNSPDYESLDSCFTAGILSGKMTLDSIKAALASTNNTGVKDNSQVAMWGYSGGSIATGWAAELQPSYAPDLKINGAAVGGLVANISAVAENVNGKLTAGFLPAGILGLCKEYPDLNKLKDEQLYKQNGTKFENALNQCSTANLLEYHNQDIFSYWKAGKDLLYLPLVQKVMQQNTMGKSAPTIPLFVFEGEKDEIVPIDSCDDIIGSFCAGGANIEYNKDPTTSHISTASNAAADVLKFLKKALEKKVDFKGCTTRTTTFGSATSTGSQAAQAFAVASSTGTAAISTYAASFSKAFGGNPSAAP